MTSHNSNYCGRPQEGFKMVRADTKVDAMRLWRWLWIDDVVQKRHLDRKRESQRLCDILKYWYEKGADLYCFFY